MTPQQLSEIKERDQRDAGIGAPTAGPSARAYMDRRALLAYVEELQALLRDSIRPHHVCDENGWYSCPASGQCLDEQAGKGCNCGADRWNAKVLAKLGEAVGG